MQRMAYAVVITKHYHDWIDSRLERPLIIYKWKSLPTFLGPFFKPNITKTEQTLFLIKLGKTYECPCH